MDSHTPKLPRPEVFDQPNRIYSLTSYHIHNPTMEGVTKMVEEIQMVDGVTLDGYEGRPTSHRYYGESRDPQTWTTKQVSVYVHYPYARCDPARNGTNI